MCFRKGRSSSRHSDRTLGIGTRSRRSCRRSLSGRRLARLIGRGLPDRQKPPLALREQNLAQTTPEGLSLAGASALRAACNSLAKRVPPRGGCVTPAPCLGFHLDFGDCRRGPPRTAAEILAATDYTHNCHQSVLQRSRPLAARGGKGPRRREAAASFHVRPPSPTRHGAGLLRQRLAARSMRRPDTPAWHGWVRA